MTVIPFDERPSSQTSPAAQSESPDGRPHQDDRKERAVIELLEHGVLSHAIRPTWGIQGPDDVGHSPGLAVSVLCLTPWEGY